LAAAAQEVLEQIEPRSGKGFAADHTVRQKSTQPLPALPQIDQLPAIVIGLVEGGGDHFLVRQWNPEAGAELLQLLFIELLLLVGDVPTLARLAQAVSLDGVSQDHRRRSSVLDGSLVGG